MPKKLGIRQGHRVSLVHEPEGFVENTLEGLPPDVDLVGTRAGKVDVCVLFVTREKSLRKDVTRARTRISRDGALWICWPKRASGKPTDLSFDVVQRVGLESGLVDVKICAVDPTWSGLRFVYRLKDR